MAGQGVVFSYGVPPGMAPAPFKVIRSGNSWPAVGPVPTPSVNKTLMQLLTLRGLLEMDQVPGSAPGLARCAIFARFQPWADFRVGPLR